MPEKKTRKVDVVIVNYRTAELTKKAVQSVLDEEQLGKVVVVDNFSSTEEAERLSQVLEGLKGVELVLSEKNIGFGPGNNLGVQYCNAEYLFFLNSDAEILPGCLSELVGVLEADPGIGVVAPRVFLHEDNSIQEDAYGVFPTVKSILLRKDKKTERENIKPDWISGVAFMVRRTDFIDFGGFNSNLFMYFEDVELCWRYKKVLSQGCYIDDGATVIHYKGKSKVSTVKQKQSYYASQDKYLKIIGTSWFGLFVVKLVRAPYFWIAKTFFWK